MKEISAAALERAVRRFKALATFAPFFILFAAGGLAFAATRPLTVPFHYHFTTPGTVLDAPSSEKSTSLYFWLVSGSKITIAGGIGTTATGSSPAKSETRKEYAASDPVTSDGGTHPQNLFRMFLKDFVSEPSVQIYVKRIKDNLSNPANRNPYIGESLFARYQGEDNHYYGGLRADGAVVIKKRTGSKYQTLGSKKILPGTYDKESNYDLMPLNKWIGLKLEVLDTSKGPQLTLYTDIGKTGTWTKVLSVVDDPARFGPPVKGAGLVGIESDFADAQFDEFLVNPIPIAAGKTSGSQVASAGTPRPPAPSPTPPPAHPPAGGPTPPPAPKPSPTPSPTPPPPPPAGGPKPVTAGYDAVVMGDKPVLFLKMDSPKSGKESDMSGKGHTGTYKGGVPSTATMPNGDSATVFNGSSQYLTVPSSADFSIPTTKSMTWEAWVRPDVLDFPYESGDGYIDWMGKCESYSPTCEWEARLYGSATEENRPNRFSAYVFNSSAGLGSGADWQPNSGVLKAGKWVHVVAEYQLGSTPSPCNSSSPGTINIWVNGVKQSFDDHAPTGCMSQYNVKPKAGSSPLNIGTMSMDTWFKGAVGKVAIYDRLLSQAEITEHFKSMTGKSPSGSCADKCTAPMI